MTGNDVIASYTDHVLRVVAHIIALEDKTGRSVQLALEPEPYCFLETTDETVAYFRDHLYSGASVEKLAKLAHVPIADANAKRSAAMLGIVYDICHQARSNTRILFRNPCRSSSTAAFPIFKFQEARRAAHPPK